MQQSQGSAMSTLQNYHKIKAFEWQDATITRIGGLAI
jgi:hypothetical protein